MNKISDFFNVLKQGDFPEFFVKYKKYFFTFLVGLLFILILVYWLCSNETKSKREDFFTKGIVLKKFELATLKNPSQSNWKEDLSQLEAILRRHPEFGPDLDGVISQNLLLVEEIPQALTYGKKIWNRTKKEGANLYQSYAETSFLVEQKKFLHALEQTKKLQNEIDLLPKENKLPFLELSNLIRLALIHKELNQSKEEFETWKLIKEKLSNKKLEKFTNLFNTKGMDFFSDYIRRLNMK